MASQIYEEYFKGSRQISRKISVSSDNEPGTSNPGFVYYIHTTRLYLYSI